MFPLMSHDGRMAIATEFTRMFGCQHPVQQAGMGGVPTADLALAVARGGGLGMLTGTLGRDALAAQLDAIPPDMPVGVNFLVPFLDRAALDEAAGRSPLVEFFWGEPDPELVEVVHSNGARAAWQVGSASEARAAHDAGCDLIIAQGVEAGGHVRGKIGLFSLLDEILPAAAVPVVATGGIGSGRTVAAALVAGADAVRLGTVFLATIESPAHPKYVDALIAARAEDTMVTTAFGDGWPDAPHRVLRSAIAAGTALGDAQSWTPQWPMVGTPDPIDAQALYAGESVDGVHSRQPAARVLEELMVETERALRDAARIL